MKNIKGYFYANLGSDINMPYAQYDFSTWTYMSNDTSIKSR